MRTRSRLRPAWKIALTLILLGVLLSYVDLEQALDLLSRISPWWLVPLMAVQLADRWLMSWKWRILLNAEEEYIGATAAFKAYYIASFQGFIIPFGVGPDIVRFLRLRGSGIPQERLAASLILERAIGTVASALAAAVSFTLFVLILREETPGWMVPLILAVGTGVAVSIVFMRSGRFRGFVGGLPGARLFRRFESSPWWLAIAAYKDREGAVLRFFGWSVVEQYMAAVATWLAALALGLPVGLLACLAAVPIISLLERLPITVMGLGIREGSFAFLFGLLGLRYSESIILALLEFTVFVFTLLPAGAWDMLSRGRRVAVSGEAPPRARPLSDLLKAPEEEG